MEGLIVENVGVKVPGRDGKINWLLKNINLTIHPGDRIGLLGHNGSGKTTLTRLLVNLEKPTTGRIRRVGGGFNITAVLQRSEDHFLYGTVGEQIQSYSRGKLRYEGILSIMREVGLPVEKIGWPPLLLSTGQQRLVTIACALASGANFLVFDEPMAGLDEPGRALVKEALLHLAANRSLGWVIVSHHPDDLPGLIDTVWLLAAGEQVYVGPPEGITLHLVRSCVAEKDRSLWNALWMLKSQGVALPDHIFNLQDPQAIAAELTEILK